MKSFHAVTITAVLLGIFVGCNQQSVPEAKVEAFKRWHFARAQILFGIAKEHYRSGQLKEARAKLREALRLDDKHTEARILLGKVYIEQGHYALAIVEFDKIRNRKGELPRLLYLTGIAREKQGRLEDALLSYRRAHALDPKNLAPVTAAAEVLVALNRIREAQIYVESYLALAESDPALFEMAGRISAMRKEWEQAAEHYQQALDLSPKNIYYKRALAKMQFFAGQYRLAKQSLNNLLKDQTDKSPVWVYAMLGDCYLALGRARDARDTYQVAIELKPLDAGVWTNLAKAAMALRDTPRAILSARRALEISPNRLDATMLLAYALIRNDQARLAIGVLNGAVIRYDDSSMVYCLLGRAYAAVGNIAEARRSYAAAIRVEPGNKLARELLTGIGIQKISKVN